MAAGPAVREARPMGVALPYRLAETAHLRKAFVEHPDLDPAISGGLA